MHARLGRCLLRRSARKARRGAAAFRWARVAREGRGKALAARGKVAASDARRVDLERGPACVGGAQPAVRVCTHLCSPHLPPRPLPWDRRRLCPMRAAAHVHAVRCASGAPCENKCGEDAARCERAAPKLGCSASCALKALCAKHTLNEGQRGAPPVTVVGPLVTLSACLVHVRACVAIFEQT